MERRTTPCHRGKFGRRKGARVNARGHGSFSENKGRCGWRVPARCEPNMRKTLWSRKARVAQRSMGASARCLRLAEVFGEERRRRQR